MNSAYQQLLQEVRRDIAHHEAELVHLRQLEQYLAGKVAGQKGDLPLSNNGSPAALPDEPESLTQGEAAERVLRQANQPLATNDLVERIVQQGLYPERGDRKQLINSVYSAMRRDDRFVKSGRGVWSLKEWENLK